MSRRLHDFPMEKIKEDPDRDKYIRRWSEMYERANYEEGISGYFLLKSHMWAERPFGPEIGFSNVLEVGAGTGVHIRFVRHAFENYWLTDLNPSFLGTIGAGNRLLNGGRVHIRSEDAGTLSFADSTFDRLIAAHVLEHLAQPHVALREWARVLKPGGLLSLVLPCDPGAAWRIGRAVGARRKFIRAGIEYDYWMAREHVNPINNLVSFVRYYFDNVREEWWPLKVPSMDLNLFYIAHIRV
jgi:phosphatidylethanolamine/phosphatidyl-N-methylethanolamine N-methyltransferase